MTKMLAESRGSKLAAKRATLLLFVAGFLLLGGCSCHPRHPDDSAAALDSNTHSGADNAADNAAGVDLHTLRAIAIEPDGQTVQGATVTPNTIDATVITGDDVDNSRHPDRHEDSFSNFKEVENGHHEIKYNEINEDGNDNGESLKKSYQEFTRFDDYPYYGTDAYPYYIENPPLCNNPTIHSELSEQSTGQAHLNEEIVQDCVYLADFTTDEFMVAGVNLGLYRNDATNNNSHQTSAHSPYHSLQDPFLLFDDFDISDWIRGDEGWVEMISYRKKMKRPSLSWNYDKVALKRWLSEHGYPQPKQYFLMYKDELVTASGTKEEEAAVILQNLPKAHGYCAKPSHMSMTMGNWLVDLNPNLGEVKFTTVGSRLSFDKPFDPAECADSLAEALQRQAVDMESWALQMVRPGIVVEELFSNHEDRDLPPHEFKIFVIWGRVYMAQWVFVHQDSLEYVMGNFYRNGTQAPGCVQVGPIPEWVPWKELLRLAEDLAGNKDMLRVDIFVGVPRYSSNDTSVRVAFSEFSFHPTTMFCTPFIADEMARLWVAGYKIGNFKAVPNTQVPEYFKNKATSSTVH
jgi:hypothetical protein